MSGLANDVRTVVAANEKLNTKIEELLAKIEKYNIIPSEGGKPESSGETEFSMFADENKKEFPILGSRKHRWISHPSDIPFGLDKCEADTKHDASDTHDKMPHLMHSGDPHLNWVSDALLTTIKLVQEVKKLLDGFLE